MVVRSTGSWYEVLAEDGSMYRGRLRGKFKKDGFKTTNPIAVGDFVLYREEDPDENTVLILDIEERENYVVRQSTHKKGNRHIIAANVDQVLVMATLGKPRTSPGFIDRCLVSAESFHIPAIILFNKLDILTEKGLAFQQEFSEMYRQIGYQSLGVSAQEGTHLAELEVLLEGKKTLIIGHSGVGKSTLINRLIPGVQQRTSGISHFANKGVHTTTFAEMFNLNQNSLLIDTPGIKELGIIGLEENEVWLYMPEIRQVAEYCKFYNCTHRHEPGCAVIAAVEEGIVPETRYHSYLSILQNEDNRR